ncbi:GM18416 [Drosophila sechellia]|nr:GM18416 [Drosophila sechellia]
MINLARETQKMLAEIGAEKRASEERGHGEHAD